eukprot:scaffold376602_cov15-Prasinocladus_malaysianus.AAC.1
MPTYISAESLQPRVSKITTRDGFGASTPEASEKLARGTVSRTLWAALPGAGEYYLRIKIVSSVRPKR